MIMTNHTYDVIGSMFPQKEMGGGSGLKYAASSIIYLGKRKEKDGTEVVGNIIHCKNYKSRITKENAQIDVRLTYKKGLDRHYGLLDFKLNKQVYLRKYLQDMKHSEVKRLVNLSIQSAEKYFTDEVLTKIDEYTKQKFTYGQEEDAYKRYAFAQKEGDEFSCVKILEGKYKGVIYHYGRVALQEEFARKVLPK